MSLNSDLRLGQHGTQEPEQKQPGSSERAPGQNSSGRLSESSERLSEYSSTESKPSHRSCSEPDLGTRPASPTKPTPRQAWVSNPPIPNNKMTSLGRQFILMFWKNWILQKRKALVTVFEILLPILFAFILVIIRRQTEITSTDSPTTWPPFPVDQGLPMTVTANRVLFSPNTTLVRSIMASVETRLGVTVEGFNSEEDLLRLYIYDESADQVLAGVAFNFNNTVGNLATDATVSYKIRPRKEAQRWQTIRSYPFRQNTDPRKQDSPFGASPNYYTAGFLSLQHAIDAGIIEALNNSVDVRDLSVSLGRIAYPPHYSDPFVFVVQLQLPLFVMLSFVLNSIQIASNVAYEKEKKLKESMKMMGLSNFIYWLSWYVKNWIYLLVACLVYAILLCVDIGGREGVLGRTNGVLFFLFMVFYISAIIPFCFAVSVFFQKANSAAAAGGIIYFISYIPYFFINTSYETMSRSLKLLTCVLPNVAMAMGITVIGYHEGTGIGAQWSNLSEPAIIDDNFTLLDAFGMLLLDVFLFLLITWYVDAVKPGEFGSPLPWYFPVTSKYWCGTKSDFTSHDHEGGINDPDKNNAEFFEKDPVDLVAGISIRELRKTFGKGSKKKVAVDGTSLNMYEGQITALLGHNGAGKTTTMSMITGFLPPTSGTAIVNGFDIRKDLSSVRSSLGLCPQHDILFDNMTVEEHLRIFAQLKGCDQSKVGAEVSSMIGVLNLDSKRKSRSSTLSGGQKRKLSVGIALIANSKIVVLDEPTSGMDPDARRQIWDILQTHREGRTMLLTTHFMDEADILGDRIAIMAEGVVKCCGTSLFLKNKYGAGYHMIMVKTDSCDVNTVNQLVLRHVPTANLESDVSAELSYRLPHEQSSKFEALFLELEEKKESLGILSFGASVTTMEEVFLRVGETKSTDDGITEQHRSHLSDSCYENKVFVDTEITTSSEEKTVQSKDITKDEEEYTHIDFNKDIKKNSGVSLYLQQFHGMLVKKMIHTFRNRTVTLVQLLLPVIFTIIALVVAKISENTEPDPERTFSTTPFKNALVPYTAGVSPNQLVSNMAGRFGNLLSDILTPSIFINVTGGVYTNISDYFLTDGNNLDIYTFNKKYVLGATFQSDMPLAGINLTTVIGYFSAQPYHAAPVSLNLVMNVLFRHFTSSSGQIIASNYPLPATVDTVGSSGSGLSFSIAFNILFGLAFLSTSFVIFLIKEKETQAKHVQSVSGVHVTTFWAANFVWDFVSYLIPVAIILLVFVAFQTEAYVQDGRLGNVLLLFLAYGWAVLPFMYLLHFLFKTPSGGMAALTMANIGTGLLTLLAVFILKIESLGTRDIGLSLQWVFAVPLPNYCLGQGLTDLYTNYETLKLCESINYNGPCDKDTCGDSCISYQTDYLAWGDPGIGRYLVFLAGQGFVFIFLVLLIESRKIESIWYRVRPPPTPEATLNDTQIPEDSDVAEERKRINNSSVTILQNSNTLILQNLSKYYGNFLATDHLCLGVPKGETFGLLGVNGAGKTTTFKMMTGEHMVSEGNAFLNGYDVKRNIKKVQQNLGYCPQFDALIDQMTGRETLRMYARLRGVHSNKIEDVINNLLKALMLDNHADKETSKYSGGNKRKLSTALALIGDPPIIFLDEPTTGMDPGARRQLWNVLADIRASGRTLILTSHSMEECDALCTRLAIMVNGTFMCLGSPQHLKNKFGLGYTLICRISGDENDMARLKDFIESRFPQYLLLDDRQGYMCYQLTSPNLSLAYIFGTLERAREEYKIEDYSVSQTTLEQVFLNFCKHQKPGGSRKGACGGCLCC